MPKNIDALGVYIYEGVNKGAHLLAELRWLYIIIFHGGSLVYSLDINVNNHIKS
jgi:hypothetical protein